MPSLLLMLCSQEAAFGGRACRIVWLALVSLAPKNGTEQGFLSRRGSMPLGHSSLQMLRLRIANGFPPRWYPPLPPVPGGGPHRGVKPWEEVRDMGRSHGLDAGGWMAALCFL